MSMFCYQCQETSKGKGCTIQGVCGKTSNVAKLQDLLIYTLKGISILGLKADELNMSIPEVDKMLVDGLFMTITNANFDSDRFVKKIKEALKLREELKVKIEDKGVKLENLHDSATWTGDTVEAFEAKADSVQVGVLATENEDIRSLRELTTYGVKGMAAYSEHADRKSVV